MLVQSLQFVQLLSKLFHSACQFPAYFIADVRGVLRIGQKSLQHRIAFLPSGRGAFNGFMLAGFVFGFHQAGQRNADRQFVSQECDPVPIGLQLKIAKPIGCVTHDARIADKAKRSCARRYAALPAKPAACDCPSPQIPLPTAAFQPPRRAPIRNAEWEKPNGRYFDGRIGLI